MRALDLYAGMTPVVVQIPATISSTGATAAFVDVSAFDGQGFAVLTCNTTAGTSPTLAAKLQEDTDAAGGTATDLAGGGFTTVTGSSTTDKHQVLPVRFNDTKGKLGLLMTIGGTSSPAATVGCVLYGRKRVL